MAEFTLNADEVLSANNIEQATVAPTAPVNLSDPLGILTQLETESNLSGLKATEAEIAGQLQQANQKLRDQQIAIGGQTVGLNVIRGEQAQARQLGAAELQALSEQLGVAQTARLAAQESIQQKFNILSSERTRILNIAQQAPGAGIKLTDSPEKIQKKLAEYEKSLEKKAEKDSLKESLRSLGLSTKGSRGELERRLGKASKEALDEAKKNADLDYQIKLTQLNKLRQSTTVKTEEEEINDLWGGSGQNTFDSSGDVNEVESAFNNIYGYGLTGKQQ